MDKYAKFAELAAEEVEGTDYRIQTVHVANSKAAVIAPHGGGIEPGTSFIAQAIANNEISLYLFEGIKKPNGNGVLHITSHHFDEPECLRLIAQADTVVAIHGCRGPKSRICVGGLDLSLKRILCLELQREGLPVANEGHEYPGTEPMNICNRGARQCGVQLEVSSDLRCNPHAQKIVDAVRRALNAIESGSISLLVGESPKE